MFALVFHKNLRPTFLRAHLLSTRARYQDVMSVVCETVALLGITCLSRKSPWILSFCVPCSQWHSDSPVVPLSNNLVPRQREASQRAPLRAPGRSADSLESLVFSFVVLGLQLAGRGAAELSRFSPRASASTRFVQLTEKRHKSSSFAT